jgi:hypothetical protein
MKTLHTSDRMGGVLFDVQKERERHCTCFNSEGGPGMPCKNCGLVIQ